MLIKPARPGPPAIWEEGVGIYNDSREHNQVDSFSHSNPESACLGTNVDLRKSTEI